MIGNKDFLHTVKNYVQEITGKTHAQQDVLRINNEKHVDDLNAFVKKSMSLYELHEDFKCIRDISVVSNHHEVVLAVKTYQGQFKGVCKINKVDIGTGKTVDFEYQGFMVDITYCDTHFTEEKDINTHCHVDNIEAASNELLTTLSEFLAKSIYETANA